MADVGLLLWCLVVQVYSGCGEWRGTLGSSLPASISVCGGTATGETIFKPTDKPATFDEISQLNWDGVTVGLRFTVKTSGLITAVRFIKPSGDVEQHGIR